MARLRYNLVQATLGADLLSGSSSITFNTALTEGGVNIPTISGGDIIALRVDQEIMHLTAYTAGATTGTVLRAQEQSEEADHYTASPVRHVITKEDVSDGGSKGVRTVVVVAADAPESWLDVADFVCDGTNDEVQLADAATLLDGGGIIQLSPGSFSIGAQVNTLWANGATTLRGVPSSTWFEIDYNPPLTDLEDVGGSTAVFRITSYGGSMEDIGLYYNDGSPNTDSVLFFVSASDFAFRNCEFDSDISTCIYGYAVSNIALTIDKCVIDGSPAIWMTKQRGLAVRNSTIRPYNNEIGIRLRDAAGVGYGTNDKSQATIIGNTFSGGSVHVAVESNNFDGMGGPIIKGNHFMLPGDAAVKITGSDQCIVEGNRILGNNATGHGIWLLTAANSNVIKGNVFSLVGKHGIFLDGSNDNIIEGNSITSASQFTTNTWSSIFLTNSDGNLVTGNQIRKGSATPKPLYGIRVDTSTCDNNTIAGNDLLDASNAAGNEYSDAGTGTRTGWSGRVSVAASNATSVEKVGATFLCDGTNDEVQISAALALAASGVGNAVYLSSGTFQIGAAITVVGNRHRLVGAGTYATHLRRSAAGSYSVFNLNGPTLNLERLRVHDDGTLATTGPLVIGSDIELSYAAIENDKAGLAAVSLMYGIKGENSYIGADGPGIIAAPTTAGLVKINLTDSEINSWSSVAISDDETALTISSQSQISLTNCVLYAGGSTAILSTGKGVGDDNPIIQMYNVDVWGDNDAITINTATSVTMYGVRGLGEVGHFLKINNTDIGSIHGLRVSLAGTHGLWLLDCNDILVDAPDIRSASTLTDDTYSGILLDGDTNNCAIQGALIRRAASGNAPKYGIRVDDATCDNNFIVNNDLLNSAKSGGTGAAFSDAGTGTVTAAGNRT